MNERKSPSQGVLDFGGLNNESSKCEKKYKLDETIFSGASVFWCSYSKSKPLSQIKYMEKCRIQPCSPRYHPREVAMGFIRAP